jgi:hypothetical protein
VEQNTTAVEQNTTADRAYKILLKYLQKYKNI